MALVDNIIKLRGSAGDLTYYRLHGAYYVRMKSSLTGHDFWSKSCFTKSRESCRRFAEGNRLASLAYKTQPKKKQLYAVFCQLKTAAIHYLKLGLTAEQTYPLLVEQASWEVFVLPGKDRKPRTRKVFPYANLIDGKYFVLPASRYLKMAIEVGNEALQALAESSLYCSRLYTSYPQRKAETA